MRYSFPAQLAKQVQKHWLTDVAYDSSYRRPTLPVPSQLRHILETAFFTSLEREEDRTLQFVLCCVPELPVTRDRSSTAIPALPFAQPRPLTVPALRSLAPAVSRSNAAIIVQFNPGSDKTSAPAIHGILATGGDRARARSGKSSYYDVAPHALLVDVSGPGRIRIYQSDIMIAGIDRGQLLDEPVFASTDFIGAHKLIRQGVNALFPRIKPPRKEHIKEWDSLQWSMLLGVVLSIVGSIRDAGHGGTLLLLGPQSPREIKVRFKYAIEPPADHLSDRYVSFMNARHRLADKSMAMKHLPQPRRARSAIFLKYEYEKVFAEQQLADMIEAVAALGAVDGALVLRSDLRTVGFGAEILTDTLPKSKVYEVSGDVLLSKNWPELDDQAFGMRHRSAVRFIASHKNAVAFVVSQDGAVSFCWQDDGCTYIKRNVKVSNPNMLA